MKIVFTSDWHLGLKSSELSRTKEIVQVGISIANHAVKSKADLMVFGGDIFNTNNPNEFLISQFIRVLNILKRNNIKTYVMVGNHDAFSNGERYSCLDFLNTLKVGYPNVKLVSDIKCIELGMMDYGRVFLTFLPHITKAHLKNTKLKTPQDYINHKTKQIFKKVGKGQTNIVFSHLNVKGLIPGSEENLLNRSEVFVPDFLINPEERAYNDPIIIQAHLHSNQEVGNIHVIGSPIYCSFGEKDKNKYFAEINIPSGMNEDIEVKCIKTKCKRFFEYSWDNDISEKENIKTIKTKANEKTIIKVNALVKDNNSLNWRSITQEIETFSDYCRPIIPRYKKEHISRNKKQSMKLEPKEAIKVWLKKNKPNNAKRKFKLAKAYL